MAPKKNAFLIFLNDYKNNEIKKGNKSKSINKLAEELTPVWKCMSDEEKNKYKMIANQFNTNRKQENYQTQIVQIHDNSSDYWAMKDYLTLMFECIHNKTELLNKNFILLHVNCHAHNGEQYYFPAEIAALEFNLTKGVFRTYHQIIGISNIYPRGYAGGLREYSDKFHGISCWHDHPDNYKNILLEFMYFLKGETIKHTAISEGVLDLPYMFTLESGDGLDMMKTKNSLERLYKTVFPDHDTNLCKSVFKIGSIEQLLFEITKKLNIHLDEISLRSRFSIHEILEFDMYGQGLGCVYHETRDIAYKCSKSRIFQWMSNICKHINEHTGLQLLPGKHIAVQLKDGSRMIVENEHIPLSKQDLKINDTITQKVATSNYLYNTQPELTTTSSTSNFIDHFNNVLNF